MSLCLFFIDNKFVKLHHLLSWVMPLCPQFCPHSSSISHVAPKIIKLILCQDLITTCFISNLYQFRTTTTLLYSSAQDPVHIFQHTAPPSQHGLHNTSGGTSSGKAGRDPSRLLHPCPLAPTGDVVHGPIVVYISLHGSR